MPLASHCHCIAVIGTAIKPTKLTSCPQFIQQASHRASCYQADRRPLPCQSTTKTQPKLEALTLFRRCTENGLYHSSLQNLTRFSAQPTPYCTTMPSDVRSPAFSSTARPAHPVNTPLQQVQSCLQARSIPFLSPGHTIRKASSPRWKGGLGRTLWVYNGDFRPGPKESQVEVPPIKAVRLHARDAGKVAKKQGETLIKA